MCSILLTPCLHWEEKTALTQWWERDTKVLNRTLKVWAAREDISNLSILFASFGWVMFWLLRKSRGSYKGLGGWQRENCNAGNFSILFLGYSMVLTRIANWLFLTFPKNVKRLFCSGKGVGVQSVEGGSQVAGSTFERKVNLEYGFFCPTAKPPLSYFMAYKMGKNINLFKNNGTFIIGLILSLSKAMK